MAETELRYGWRLISDFDIEPFAPDPDPELPAPIHLTERAFRSDYFTIGMVDEMAWFAGLERMESQYVVLNCKESTISRIRRPINVPDATFPQDEYETVLSSLPTFALPNGTVTIDVDKKMILVSGNK